MKHVVGYSGGLASALVAKLVADRYGQENTTLLFHDTKTEPEDNDRFRAEVAKHIGVPITEDSDGRNIWQVFEDEGILGNSRQAPCSRILKRERSLKYLLTKHNPNGDLFKSTKPAILYIGFTPDEWRRAQRTTARYAAYGIEVRFPLITQDISKSECRSLIEQGWGIQAPAMYAWAEHANCVPCVKGGLAYWGLVYQHANSAWQRASQAEDYFQHTIRKEGPLGEVLDKCKELASKGKGESIYEFPCECAT